MQYCNNKKLLYTLAKPIMSLLLLHKYFQRIARKINKIHAKVLPVLVRNYILTATITTSLQANDSWYMIILTLNCCLCLHHWENAVSTNISIFMCIFILKNSLSMFLW